MASRGRFFIGRVYKPSSVPQTGVPCGHPKRLLSFIWCSLPPGNGRVSPLLPVYLVFQPIRLAITGIAAMRRELLPRVFTLTCSGTAPCLRRRYFFCGAICCPLRDTFPLGSMGPCVARTFLPPLAWPAIEQLRFFLFCKSTKKKLPTAHFFVFD